jgi:hypothetical protein
MEFTMRQFRSEGTKGAQCDVYTLVPLQAAGEKHYQFSVVALPGAPNENRSVHVINVRGAAPDSPGSSGVLLEPKVVSYDYVIRKRCGSPFHPAKQTECSSFRVHTELTRKELWYDVMDIKNDTGAGQLRIPRSEDHKVWHVVNVKQVVRFAKVTLGYPKARQS